MAAPCFQVLMIIPSVIKIRLLDQTLLAGTEKNKQRQNNTHLFFEIMKVGSK